MRPACAVAGTVLDEVAAFVQPGVTTREVDEFAADADQALWGQERLFGLSEVSVPHLHLGQRAGGSWLGGPAALRFGDIVSLDVGVIYNGFIGDTARTVAVGGCGVLAQKLMDVTEKALYEGIAQALPGNRVVDISRAVQNYVEGNGFSVVREFVGHGVGRSMHEEPQVPNFVDGKSSPKLRPGMTMAIEPMVNAGSPGVKILNDGWTVVTQDGSLSAHFEHTVLITESEPEILTWPEKVPSKLKVS